MNRTVLLEGQLYYHSDLVNELLKANREAFDYFSRFSVVVDDEFDDPDWEEPEPWECSPEEKVYYLLKRTVLAFPGIEESAGR